MKIRTIVLAAATLAALSPALSNASAESVSLKACANAFATSIAAPGASAPDYKLAYHSNLGSPLMDFAREYTFMLEARNKSGSTFARARCLADANGVVTSIAAVPLDMKADSLASAF